MNLFVWTESLATGNAYIDNEHHDMVERVNAVLSSIAHKQADAALQQALQELLDFTRDHFVREEEQMRRIAFKGMQNHCIGHTQLMNQLEDVRQQLLSGKPVEQMDLYHFLTWWVKDHIRLEDTGLAAAMRAFASDSAREDVPPLAP
jgi:hemerythrin-like metal-binding protein